MYDDGYTKMINIDISSVVIKKMQEHCAKVNKTLECKGDQQKTWLTSQFSEVLEMDATHMTFEDSSFDLIIDKGTLDAVLCGEDNVAVDLCKEMGRVCCPDGSIYIISHGSPHHRKQFFKKVYPLEQYEIHWIKQGSGCVPSSLCNFPLIPRSFGFFSIDQCLPVKLER